MSIFDEKPEPKSPGCPICGTANKAIVAVRIYETNNGKTPKGTRTVTRSRSLCLQHAEDIWRHLVDELNDPDPRLVEGR